MSLLRESLTTILILDVNKRLLDRRMRVDASSSMVGADSVKASSVRLPVERMVMRASDDKLPVLSEKSPLQLIFKPLPVSNDWLPEQMELPISICIEA